MNTNELGNWVRNYVHYDNLAMGYNKQATTARKIREEYEDKIIEHLRVNSMENAIIQIAGGRLFVSEERHSQALTLHRIEELLRAYYATKGASGAGALDETPNIMKFIKQQRGFEVYKKLKKQNGAAPAPLPPPPNDLTPVRR